MNLIGKTCEVCADVDTLYLESDLKHFYHKCDVTTRLHLPPMFPYNSFMLHEFQPSVKIVLSVFPGNYSSFVINFPLF